MRQQHEAFGILTGSMRHIAALIRLKIAVLAPMPSASDSVTAAVKPGLFLRRRHRVADVLQRRSR